MLNMALASVQEIKPDFAKLDPKVVPDKSDQSASTDDANSSTTRDHRSCPHYDRGSNYGFNEKAFQTMG